MTEKNLYCWEVPRPLGYLNCGLILKNAALSYPEKLIIDANKGISRSYKEVDLRANRVANGLFTRGKPGGCVATLVRVGSIESMEAYFAIGRAGMTNVPLSFMLAPKEIENILKYAEAKAIIFDEMFKPMVDQLNLQIDKYMIGKSDPSVSNYQDLLQYPPVMNSVDIRDDFPDMLNFTSGTTGTPKAFFRTHYADFINHICCAFSFDIQHDDVALNCIPGGTGLTWAAGVVMVRATLINIDFDPVTVLKTIEKYKVTIIWGVPVMFARLLDVPDLGKYDLSSLRAIASVGAAFPLSTLERVWENITPNVYEELGMQEVGFITLQRPDMKRKKPASVGPPAVFSEFRVVDEQGNDKPVGEVGEIICRSPQMTGEYWRNPEKTKESFRGRWFYSGDLGKVDEEGHLYVVGRQKDMIISGGYNVFAMDVENELLIHPKIADCAVIGLPDEEWGEKVTAIIKLKMAETVTEEEIVKYCQERMAKYKVPKLVVFGDIPRTASGKIQKQKIADSFKKT